MINTLVNAGWDDYELLDSGNGEKLERFGKYRLIRPDPDVLWLPTLPKSEWETADAIFVKTTGDKGIWKGSIPQKWEMTYMDIHFFAKLTPFKHTGVFPEQSVHWEWMKKLVEKNTKPLSVLNLFGYTGIASLIAAKAGAHVTHVDASYPAIGWGRENQKLSGLEDKPIRWIEDDVIKFVQREIKRGVTYEGIIMDPPTFGHGPKGERWEFSEMFSKLMNLTQQILSEKALFFLVNAYAISSSSIMLQNVFTDHFAKLNGTVETGELVLQATKSQRLLSTGIFGRWSKNSSME